MGGFVVVLPRHRPIPDSAIDTVVRVSAERAPDGVRKLTTPEGVVLVQCHFANTAESVGEVLPKAGAGGSVWIVKRGHLTNPGALRAMLSRRHDGPLQTDADLMLASYLVWGPHFADQLEGEFTIAIWDGRSERLIVARDPFGLRGCYVHQGPEVVAVASEPAQLLGLPGVTEELDEIAIVDFCTGYQRDLTRTFFSSITRPLPASVGIYDRQGLIREFRYWEPPEPSTQRSGNGNDFERCVADIRASFETAMIGAMRAPGAVAVDLSGGLDSSAVFGVAAHLLRGGRSPVEDVWAFSKRYPGHDFDESSYIDSMLAKWPLPSRSVDGQGGGDPTVDPHWLADTMRHPVGTPGTPSGFAEMRSTGTRVRLTGDLGDAVFRSAPIPITRPGRPKGEWWPYLWWASAGNWRSMARRVRREMVRPLVPDRALDAYLRRRGRIDDGPDIFTPRGRTLVDAVDQPSVSALWSPADLAVVGTDDGATLRYGFEVRWPFAHRPLVEQSFSAPPLYHRWGGEWRAIQKAAFRDVYSGEVHRRRDKAEFSYLNAPSGPPRARRSVLAEMGLADPAAVDQYLRGSTRQEGIRIESWGALCVAFLDGWLDREQNQRPNGSSTAAQDLE